MAARGYETIEPFSRDSANASFKLMAIAIAFVGALVLCGVTLVFVFRLLEFFATALWIALG